MKFQPEVFTESGLFYGDNLYIMQELMNIGYKEKFDLIYFDGPFNSGWVFSAFHQKLNEQIIDPWNETATIRNFYDSNSYRSQYQKRVEVAKELLNKKGILVFHTSQKEGHYMKVILDEIFGSRHFLGEVIWKFAEDPSYARAQFGLNHESLFFYAKSDEYLKKMDASYSSVWDDVGKYEHLGEEDTFYATQKPEKLMERILEMTTDENALVGDFYCGSGTMAFVAEKLKRRWIASDHSRVAIQTTVSRMEAIGIEVPVYQLVDDFHRSYVQGQRYIKETNIPFSLNEWQGLNKEFPNKPITVQAYEYTPEVDLIQDENYTFQLMMPSVNPDGSQEVVIIPRPVPLLTREGYQLLIANPLDWISHHIIHGQIAEDRYIMDADSLQQRVNDVYLKIKDNWIDSVKQYDDYDLLIDVFGYFYKVPKGRMVSYGK